MACTGQGPCRRQPLWNWVTGGNFRTKTLQKYRQDIETTQGLVQYPKASNAVGVQLEGPKGGSHAEKELCRADCLTALAFIEGE